MPAAAVIPAPIAYIKVVAVKKLVVEFLGQSAGSPSGVFGGCSILAQRPPFTGCAMRSLYCEKIRVFKASVRLNTLAWNNEIGLRCYFVGCVPSND